MTEVASDYSRLGDACADAGRAVVNLGTRVVDGVVGEIIPGVQAARKLTSELWKEAQVSTIMTMKDNGVFAGIVKDRLQELVTGTELGKVSGCVCVFLG